MPLPNKLERSNQPTWPVYVLATILVGLLLAIVNTPLAFTILSFTWSTPGAASIIFLLALIGIPTIAVDIWLIRWLKTNLLEFRWTNQTMRVRGKGDRPC